MPIPAAAAKALPASERRATTIAAVLELAATRNPADITTTAIAEQMGLTQGALFKHFPSKDALIVAVMEWVRDTLTERLTTAEAIAHDPLDALERMFLAHASFVAEHPGVPRIVFSELQRDGASAPRRVVQAMQHAYGERIHRQLLAAQRQKQVGIALDLVAARTLFIGTMQGLVFQSLMSDDLSHLARNAPAVFGLYRQALEASR